jgi:hypothetical protein
MEESAMKNAAIVSPALIDALQQLRDLTLRAGHPTHAGNRIGRTSARLINLNVTP